MIFLLYTWDIFIGFANDVTYSNAYLNIPQSNHNLVLNNGICNTSYLNHNGYNNLHSHIGSNNPNQPVDNEDDEDDVGDEDDVDDEDGDYVACEDGEDDVDDENVHIYCLHKLPYYIVLYSCNHHSGFDLHINMGQITNCESDIHDSIYKFRLLCVPHSLNQDSYNYHSMNLHGLFSCTLHSHERYI